MDPRKRRWFNRGVSALRIAAPMAGSVYRCPLCLHDFNSPDDLSLEHVPPRSVGGRELVLTCKACNDWSGHKLDFNVANRRKVEDFGAGHVPLKARLEINEHEVKTEITCSQEEVRFTIAHERNDPAKQRAMQEYLPTLNPDNVRVRITLYPPRVDPWAEKASWLRAGYLVVFAALGYRYILDNALHTTREQIRNFKTDPVGWCCAMTDEAAPEQQLIYVQQPSTSRCMLVRMGRYAVLLPERGDSDLYQRATRHVDKAGHRAEYTGALIPWPTEPVLALDFNPPGRYLPR